MEGSSLYSAQFGSLRLISTAVEPNPYCRSRECSLYGSRNGGEWQRLAVHRKDVLSPVYFQFGALVLPYTQPLAEGQSWADQGFVYSGQAVTGLDGRMAIVRPRSQIAKPARAA